MQSHTITGGGGTQLHLVETGKSTGRPILFLHGISQSCLTWSRQFNSDLAKSYRLVAMDLRGHGLSEKPAEGYTDSRLWADDVNAAIHALSLDHPILSGWSYGPLIILDYIRHYGEDEIGGINLIGAVTQLGSEAALSVLTPEFLALVPGFFATEVEPSVQSLRSLLLLCFREQLSAQNLFLMLGCSVSVPPSVRQAMFSRSFSNDDLLPKLRKPVLITHGAEDRVVRTLAVEQHKRGIGHAQVQLMANAGHGCFWDDAAGFAKGLGKFAEGL
jgi:pimeloyl-ACP methyl ester carboxylesterase